MTTKCPVCGKYVDRRDVEKHLAAHDRADAVGKTLDRLATMSDAEVAALAAQLRKGDRR
jgi:hypothetical protein